jgi:hypothetical protein
MTNDFDHAIDRAVRDMLDAEPRADLRDRVVASAFRRNSAISVASAFRRHGLVLAAAALILLAVFIARRSDPAAPQPPVIAHGSDRILPLPPPRDVPEPPSPAARRQVRREPSITIAAASIETTVTPVPIAPLNPIAPIALTPIARNPIAPDGIAVQPLAPIDDLDIAPLTPAERR